MLGAMELHPPIETFDEGTLDVGDGHVLYYEQSGLPDGKPAVLVHGGPGGGTSPAQRRFWDPRFYRIILFDQRGCGRSEPHAGLEANTTAHLVADMERLRAHLGIERWQVLGGSWGSTLALAYAEAHAERVSEMILRGVFLVSRAELDWFYRGGASRFFPEAWERFLAPLSVEAQVDPIRGYHPLLTSDDAAVRLDAALEWTRWEARTSRLQIDEASVERGLEPEFVEALARIECHYFVNDGFLDEGQLLRHVESLAGIPGAIVQGRYDMICPPATAHALHRRWPGSRLEIVDSSGHSAFEEKIIDRLVAATDRFIFHGRDA